MPYTIFDWLREEAQVLIRVPDPPGTGETWHYYWVPFSVFDEGAPAPDWMMERTHTGQEARDFQEGMRRDDG